MSPKQNRQISCVILIASLFMGIGYATVNSVIINISGKTTSKEVTGIYITQVNYKESTNADLTNSNILSAYQTNLNSKIVLSNDDQNSSITYEITIKNSNNYDFKFDKVDFVLGEDTYNNENITFELIGLNKDDILEKNGEITFKIKFKYNGSITTNNELDSMLNFNFLVIPYTVAVYDYTGQIETLTVPHDGKYKLEVWGAQGGTANTAIGGYGSYSIGYTNLNAGETLSIVVGGKGGDCLNYSTCATGGYNGGGSSCGNHDTYFSAGGGATHIAKETGLLSTLSSKVSSILIVAGGGGGSGFYTGTLTSQYGKNNKGGNAGGYKGNSGGGPSYGIGGTQTAGGKGNTTGNAVNGSFGTGGGGASNKASGGGAGFYGGGTGFDYGSAAGGGSGYIGNIYLYDKYMICYNCTTSTEESTLTKTVTNASETATADYAKIGNGYVKIMFIDEI